MRLARALVIVSVALGIGGCAVGDYYDKWFGSAPTVKPAELVALKPSATARIVWQANVGSADRYVFSPVRDLNVVTAAGSAGQIARFDSASGKLLGRFEAKQRLSGGVGTSGRFIFVGTPKGEVVAYDQDGKELWKSQLTSEVLSAPQAAQGIVVVRSGDGRIYGLDEITGARRWILQRPLPPLTVRTHAGVVVSRGAAFAGFPGGRLVAIVLSNGAVGWEAAVAVPKGATELERVADISSLPVIDGNAICAVAFQGRVACFDVQKGSAMWAREISSVAGLALDGRNVYISDDKGAVVAYEKNAGASQWKQDKLYGRRISGPAVAGRFVAVGDFQGYVHFLSRDDGSFAARIATDGSPIVAQPLASDDGFIVQTRNGGVFAIAVQ